MIHVEGMLPGRRSTRNRRYGSSRYVVVYEEAICHCCRRHAIRYAVALRYITDEDAYVITSACLRAYAIDNITLENTDVTSMMLMKRCCHTLILIRHAMIPRALRAATLIRDGDTWLRLQSYVIYEMPLMAAIADAALQLRQMPL